jgi:mRNA interferase HigB
MRVIAKRTLRLFWEGNRRRSDAKRALEDWHAQARKAQWKTAADVKASFGDASILKAGRVVFNISGNKYRLVTQINYAYGVVYVRFIGTHSEYDAIDAEKV